MGRPNAKYYGDTDVGSAIETTEKIIAKIKTNKFDNEDLITLYGAMGEILKAVINNDYKDKE